jgi:hypothetical protein
VLGLDVSNYEVSGPIAEVVTLDALLGGRFNEAEARLFQVNPQSLPTTVIEIQFGIVTDAKPSGGQLRSR